MRLNALALAAAAVLACLALACQKPATPNNQPKSPDAPAAPAAAPQASASLAPATSDPIQKAVYDYIENVRQVNLNMLSVEIKNQKVEGTKATCDVSYIMKEDGKPFMEYSYELAQEGGIWKVTSSKAKGGTHAGMPAAGGDMPAGHPGMGGEGAPAGMPAHGTTDASGMPMPAGHPPIPEPTPAKPADTKPKTK